MAAALEMLVVEDAAPDDRKIAIASDEEMRELIDESEEFTEDPRADLHRDVLLIEANEVMGIVDVRRILEIPLLVIEGEGDETDVLPRRLALIAGKAEVFVAKKALRVGRRHRGDELSDVLIVLLGFAEVDRDLQARAILIIGGPNDRSEEHTS